MTLRVNGDPMEVAAGTTAAGLVEQLGLKPELVVVEINETILRRAELPGRELREGDQVEIVHFVGGGR
ncbi:MAG: thiamine biosynthesis protein ThiS [Candidatus Omnitrophica bacterium CG11_big_fil_rev_8_21_14_0_20_64_10]|nr:MAG: thiamine biosynthesis protein ThiS [Candidatus Omnitrophica bacterium CG11_big_fil_rev_8_21_14_0_20_64_10]